MPKVEVRFGRRGSPSLREFQPDFATGCAFDVVRYADVNVERRARRRDRNHADARRNGDVHRRRDGQQSALFARQAVNINGLRRLAQCEARAFKLIFENAEDVGRQEGKMEIFGPDDLIDVISKFVAARPVWAGVFVFFRGDQKEIRNHLLIVAEYYREVERPDTPSVWRLRVNRVRSYL